MPTPLRARTARAAGEAAAQEPTSDADREFSRARRYDGGPVSQPKAEAPKRKPSSRSDSVGEVLAKSFARQLGTKGGQAVVRGILGTFFGKR